MRNYVIIMILSAVVSSCSTFSSAMIGDDLYTSHNRIEIAARQKAEAEAARAEAEARHAAWEAKLAEARALAAENEFKGVTTTVPAEIRCWQITIRAPMLVVCMALARHRTRCRQVIIPIVTLMHITMPRLTTLHFIMLWYQATRCGLSLSI